LAIITRCETGDWEWINSEVIDGELDTDFKGQVANRENAGLDDEGFAQRWLELHPEDTVVMRDGSTRKADA
jgi:hypothetical protein